MEHWREYHYRDKKKEVKRAKLYLLALGVLILGALLFYEKREERERGRAAEGLQEDSGSQDGTTAGGPDGAAAAEEPENAGQEEPEGTKIQPLEYDGTIRVLLKTDHYEKDIHEEVRLSSASGQDLAVYGEGDGEMLDSGSSLSFTREEDTLF